MEGTSAGPMAIPTGREVAASSRSSSQERQRFVQHIQGMWRDALEKRLAPQTLTSLFRLLSEFFKSEMDFIDFLENMTYLCPDYSWEGVKFIKVDGLEAVLYFQLIRFMFKDKVCDVGVDMLDPNSCMGADFLTNQKRLENFLYDVVSDNGNMVRDFPRTIQDMWDNIRNFNPRPSGKQGKEPDPEPEPKKEKK